MTNIVGLTTSHGRGHFVRALLEGLSFWYRDALERAEAATRAPTSDEIVGIGGGSKAAPWMQIKADVTGRAVRVVGVPEAVALGAALLAGVGIGTVASAPDAAASVVRTSTLYEPDPSESAAYSERCIPV